MSPCNPSTRIKLLFSTIAPEHNGQLVLYAQAKRQQINAIQASLQPAIDNQRAKVATIEQDSPAWLATKQARAAWKSQVAQAKGRLAQPERRAERVGEIAEEAGLYADSMLDELAATSVFIILTSRPNGTRSNNSNAWPL